MTVQTAIK